MKESKGKKDDADSQNGSEAVRLHNEQLIARVIRILNHEGPH